MNPWLLVGAGAAGLGALFMTRRTSLLYPSAIGPSPSGIIHPERLEGVDGRLLDFLADWAAQGSFPLTVVPDGGLRTDAAVARLYARGRSTMGEPPYTSVNPLGRTVSNAQTATQTAHGHGGAVDVAPYIGGAIPWEQVELFKVVGAFGKARGLVWGGDWASLRDMPHFEVPDWRQLGMLVS